MRFIFMGIHYEEPDPQTYRGVTVRNGDSVTTFFTGDPTADFLAARASVSEDMVMCSSSVDHFIMDGGDLTLPWESDE